MAEIIQTGGCQCGAIRFRVRGALTASSLCHCRMCQKASGNIFITLVPTEGAELQWTRGKPKHFQSSNHGFRGFCENCGTPLTYEAPDGIALAVGAFDDPSNLAPTVQFGVEAKVAWFEKLHELPARRTEEDAEAAPFLMDVVSYQHPDRDTENWQPRKSTGDDEYG